MKLIFLLTLVLILGIAIGYFTAIRKLHRNSAGAIIVAKDEENEIFMFLELASEAEDISKNSYITLQVKKASNSIGA